MLKRLSRHKKSKALNLLDIQSVKKSIFNVSVLSLLALSPAVFSAPETEALEYWQASNESNKSVIDHSAWQSILDKYLNDKHPSDINRFNYAGIDKAGLTLLQNYLQAMQSLDPRSYSKGVQKAYWINLYNALTVQVILDNYPVKSITKTGEGIFSFGPWDDEVAEIESQELTLNNIEHGILRPLWEDNRIHYAVNCASISCPNLLGEAYTAKNTESLLQRSAKAYVNHERGVRFEDDELMVSSIYHWYAEDFGGDNASLIKHLQQYALPSLKEKLQGYQGEINNSYDWNLNEAR